MSAPSSLVQLNNPLAASAVQAYGSRTVNRLVPVEHVWSAAEAATAGEVKAAFATTTTGNTITSGITNPPCARNLVVTFGGTATDLAAVNTTISGTDIDGNVISEAFLATLNTGSTVTGSKAFKTVTSIVNGIHDGTGATIAVAFGDKLGLPYKFARNPVLRTFLGTTLEGTAATVAVSSSALESNTIDLNSALNGTAVTVEMLVPGA
jgi:hypothetical protein